jgi:hypothetical protein
MDTHGPVTTWHCSCQSALHTRAAAMQVVWIGVRVVVKFRHDKEEEEEEEEGGGGGGVAPVF